MDWLKTSQNWYVQTFTCFGTLAMTATISSHLEQQWERLNNLTFWPMMSIVCYSILFYYFRSKKIVFNIIETKQLQELLLVEYIFLSSQLKMQ